MPKEIVKISRDFCEIDFTSVFWLGDFLKSSTHRGYLGDQKVTFEF